MFEVSANKRTSKGADLVDIYCLGCCDTGSVGEAVFGGLCEIMMIVLLSV